MTDVERVKVADGNNPFAQNLRAFQYPSHLRKSWVVLLLASARACALLLKRLARCFSSMRVRRQVAQAYVAFIRQMWPNLITASLVGQRGGYGITLTTRLPQGTHVANNVGRRCIGLVCFLACSRQTPTPRENVLQGVHPARTSNVQATLEPNAIKS